MNDAQVTQGAINRYWDFVLNQYQRTGRTAPSPAVRLHSTSGDGLVAIIESGDLWTTQISCVNDSTELRYSNSLLLDVLRAKRMDRELRPHATATAKTELILYDRAIAGLSVDAAPTSERFIACLSEDGDDLSQWRAYGGGEGGYAIGFDMARLLLTLPQAQAVLAAVCYDKNIHIQIAQAVVDATTGFYLEGLKSRPSVKEEEWTETFLSAWSPLISHIAPAIKHPAFSTEREWRLVRQLQETDLPDLRFRQRQSMLGRHLPLRLHNFGTNILPIAVVRVGPSRHKEISRVSVGDLLKTKGYPQQVYDKVLISDVPFQSF